jgi:cation diffusion facilitator CzcD-associated flavoprotein CzcO
MNISALIIERNRRIGDNWRKRYPTLSLHTPRTHHPRTSISISLNVFELSFSVLYQSFPENWPIFTPRNKLADWLEQYAISQDLVVWTDSHALPTPAYDAASKRWTVVIVRAGKRITLHPAHIVIAAGTVGAPRIPSIPDADLFPGTAIHAADFAGGKAFAGQRTLVVGAGNSAADICQDLVFQGVAEVTMLQRSSTCVVSGEKDARKLERLWPPGVPTDVADFKVQAVPMLLVREIGRATTEELWAQEEETHEGLREAGLSLNMGTDGSGYFPMVFERLGGRSQRSFFTIFSQVFNCLGYCQYFVLPQANSLNNHSPGLDVGAADLIRAGRVKVKHGVEIARFTENSAVFTDDSALIIDSVIYAYV